MIFSIITQEDYEKQIRQYSDFYFRLIDPRDSLKRDTCYQIVELIEDSPLPRDSIISFLSNALNHRQNVMEEAIDILQEVDAVYSYTIDQIEMLHPAETCYNGNVVQDKMWYILLRSIAFNQGYNSIKIIIPFLANDNPNLRGAAIEAITDVGYIVKKRASKQYCLDILLYLFKYEPFQFLRRIIKNNIEEFI